MYFAEKVSNLMTRYGFTRKVATLIVRIEQGRDTLEGLTACTPPIVGMSEYLTMSQYFSEQANSPQAKPEQAKPFGVDYFNPDPSIIGNM